MNKVHEYSGRLIFIMSYPLLKIYSKLATKPRTRVLITDNKGQVLLMRSWFGHQRWDLPGGGVKRGEDPLLAALREVREETGLKLKAKDLKLIGEFNKKTTTLTTSVILYYATHTAVPVAADPVHSLEVLEAAWWPIKRLPPRINMFVVKALRRIEEVD